MPGVLKTPLMPGVLKTPVNTWGSENPVNAWDSKTPNNSSKTPVNTKKLVLILLWHCYNAKIVLS